MHTQLTLFITSARLYLLACGHAQGTVHSSPCGRRCRRGGGGAEGGGSGSEGHKRPGLGQEEEEVEGGEEARERKEGARHCLGAAAGPFS